VLYPGVAAKFGEYLAGVPDLKQLGRAERRDGLLVLVEMAIAEYVKDVREGHFPGKEYTYPIEPSDLATCGYRNDGRNRLGHAFACSNQHQPLSLTPRPKRTILRTEPSFPTPSSGRLS